MTNDLQKIFNNAEFLTNKEKIELAKEFILEVAMNMDNVKLHSVAGNLDMLLRNEKI